MAQAAKVAHTGAYIMAYVSQADAARLAVEGGEPADSLHVTLSFLSEEADFYNDEQRAILQHALRGIGEAFFPITANVFARSQFNFANGPDDERQPCSVILVQSQALADVHLAVDSVVNSEEDPSVHSADTFPIWVPHVTIGFNVDINKIGADHLGTITFDRLIMAWGETQVDVTTPLDSAYHVE